MKMIKISLFIIDVASVCWYRFPMMILTPVLVITFGFSIIHHYQSMIIPSTSSLPTHILRVRIRVHNSLIETLVNKRQLDLIEIQLKEKNIPYHEIQNNKDGITIIIGPFHKSINLTATIMRFNQSRFQTNLTKLIPIKTDSNENPIPLTVEAHEYHQESYEFLHCLESCEVYEGKEFKPDHDCIRKKCLKEITGI